MLFLLVALAAAVGAAPAPSPAPTPPPQPALAKRDIISDISQWGSSISSLISSADSDFVNEFTSLLSAISPSATPTDDAAAYTTMSSIAAEFSVNPLAAAGAVLLAGLTGGSSLSDAVADAEAFGPCNSQSNSNTASPARTIYPQQDSSDAPYDVSEDDLRAAIYIPSGFTYGKIPPVIFVPGTASEACETFEIGLGKLVAGSDFADPVYVNVPNSMLADEQNNAEYITYAINYISAVSSNSQVSVVGWSGAGPTTQWALKYWPSTQQYVRSIIAFSPDYDGTITVPLACPAGLECAPSVLQQGQGSNWLTRLRQNGGSSSFVPTTEIHNIWDEVVEPQSDPNASAEIADGGSGVTNIQVQDYCPTGTFAGGPNLGHENTLYNPVGVAIALDALKYGGVANATRAGPFDCNSLYASGLSLTDLFATEYLALVAAFTYVTYPDKITSEPALKPYATF